jgi:hypothetical protein
MAFLLLELIGSAESAINDRFVLFKHPPTPPYEGSSAARRTTLLSALLTSAEVPV